MFETPQGIIKPIVYLGIIYEDRLLLVDYKIPPNPNKTGWWIPAPGLEYGENPADLAQKEALNLGLTPKDIMLMDIESFTTPGGWHLLYHYIVKTSSKSCVSIKVKDYRWVTKDELRTINNIAHGKWEIDLGLSFLER